MTALLVTSCTCAMTFAGGLLALRLEAYRAFILAFAAGALITSALIDVIPDALEMLTRSGSAMHHHHLMFACSLGFLSFYLLEEFAHSRAPAPELTPATAADDDRWGAAHAGLWGAAGISVHSLLDGVAIGLAFQASHEVGIVVAIAVLTHDFSDGINTMNIVLKSGGDRMLALSWLAADALAPVLGVVSTFFFTLRGEWFGTVLAVFAGFFLYIGASDLIPESYHAHPKFLTTAMTLAGAAVMYLAIALIGQ